MFSIVLDVCLILSFEFLVVCVEEGLIEFMLCLIISTFQDF